jgi:hypothetical protein
VFDVNMDYILSIESLIVVPWTASWYCALLPYLRW